MWSLVSLVLWLYYCEIHWHQWDLVFYSRKFKIHIPPAPPSESAQANPRLTYGIQMVTSLCWYWAHFHHWTPLWGVPGSVCIAQDSFSLILFMWMHHNTGRLEGWVSHYRRETMETCCPPLWTQLWKYTLRDSPACRQMWTWAKATGSEVGEHRRPNEHCSAELQDLLQFVLAAWELFHWFLAWVCSFRLCGVQLYLRQLSWVCRSAVHAQWCSCVGEDCMQKSELCSLLLMQGSVWKPCQRMAGQW